jgi:hypothetical protein
MPGARWEERHVQTDDRGYRARAYEFRSARPRQAHSLLELTVYTITALQMSPAGMDQWGINQCKNDRDGTVDHDERLRITDVKPGRYDVKIADKIGRVCIVRNIDVKEGAVFTIEEKQLTECGK